MFGLIAGVIAIALGIIVSVLAIFYGGTAYSDNSGKALYAKLLNNGSQIQGAVQLYASENGGYPTGTSLSILNTLVDKNYLNAIPAGHWVVQEDKLVRELVDNNQCRAINEAAQQDMASLPASYNGCPPCADSAYDSYPSCSSPVPFE